MKLYIYISIILISISSCDLDIAPSNELTASEQLAIDGGFESATSGNYLLLKETISFNGTENSNNAYVRHLYQMSEFAGDNVMYTQFSSDPLYLVFTKGHFPAQGNSSYLWFVAYKMIGGINIILENAAEGESDENDHFIGENYFLRALASFDLVRFFAQPYSHDADAPGIVLKTSSSSPSVLARSTVGEVYDQIEEDLLKAAELMDNNASRGSAYASKEAAWALLSRLYLYKEDFDNTITYAEMVIESGKYTLATNADYIDNFSNTESSSESIFIIKHTETLSDNKGKNGSIGSMYYDDGQGGGWGEVFVSQPFIDLIQQYPEDIRNELIIIPGGDKNGFPIRYNTKFSGQNDIVNLASPQYLRLSEMYLNRAEALAHQSDAAALNDVNEIRERAGLSGAALYTVGNLGSKTLMDVVLEERRLELAYEGHRNFDLSRNKIDLDRSYEGIHLTDGNTTQVIPYDDDRNVFFIPVNEITLNPECDQNP